MRFVIYMYVEHNIKVVLKETVVNTLTHSTFFFRKGEEFLAQ